MAAVTLPEFAAGQPAATVDASLRQALNACDRAQECAVLWFAEVQRRGLYRQLGHASLQMYAVQALGFSDNRYLLFKRLADDLARLPILREAVTAGEVGWTKARQVARVATTETEAVWVEKARTTGRRELELAVKAATARRPAAPEAQLALTVATVSVPVADPPTTISLRADGVQLARYEALVERVRKLGLAPDGADRLDLVLAGLEALVASAECGRSRDAAPATQIVVQQCPDCAAAAVVTSRGEKRLAPAQVETLACDAHVRRAGGPNRATIPPSVRAAVLARDRHHCTAPGCRSTQFLEVHHVTPRRLGGLNRAENLTTLCSRCHGFVHEHGGTMVRLDAVNDEAPDIVVGLAPAQVVGRKGSGARDRAQVVGRK
jgi:5-methylcytosine-specific restriction endonuclease McrA